MAVSESDISSDSIIEISSDEMEDTCSPTLLQLKQMAEIKKDEGNCLYKQQNYKLALKCYEEAIELCPGSASFYSNRAACYMMTQDYQAALEDAKTSVKLDPTFVKGHLREAKCQLTLGDIVAARRCLENVSNLDPNNLALMAEIVQVAHLEGQKLKVDDALNKRDFRQAVYHLDQLLRVCVACVTIKLKRAECLAFLGRYQESQEIANDVLQKDRLNADAIYIRGICLYYQDNVEKAVTHFQNVLQLAPDHQKALDTYKKAKLLKTKKEAGNAAFKNGQFQEAFNLYTCALEVDPANVFTNAKLYFNRATVCSKLKNNQQSVDDASNAIKLDENYTKAYLRRAKSYMDLESYEEAVRDYETIYSKDKTRENRRLLDAAKLELKKSQRKDYYKILGVVKTASDDEIKKAYKKQALIHHPDRHANSTNEIKLAQEKKFKELGEAYNILSDPKKKSRYDNGMDIEDEGGMSGFYDIDPNMFSTVFTGPGGFHFSSGGGGGGGGGGFHGGNTSQSFPQGFQFKFS